MNITIYDAVAYMRQSVSLAAIALLGLIGGYLLLEPAISHSQATAKDQFTVTQSITSEISFAGTAADVTMDTSIPGITGGTANGATQVRVYTNDSAGYSMTILASSSPAMQGNTQGGSIRDFSTTTTGWMAEPAHTFDATTVPVNSAGFGYSVYASSTNDVDPSFSHDGSNVCGTGGATETEKACWIGASTTAYTIVNRTSETEGSGATTTIFFRTVIRSSPSPSIPEDTYVSTTTLTATTN